MPRFAHTGRIPLSEVMPFRPTFHLHLSAALGHSFGHSYLLLASGSCLVSQKHFLIWLPSPIIRLAIAKAFAFRWHQLKEIIPCLSRTHRSTSLSIRKKSFLCRSTGTVRLVVVRQTPCLDTNSHKDLMRRFLPERRKPYVSKEASRIIIPMPTSSCASSNNSQGNCPERNLSPHG